jgi:hypothetical protein
VFCGLATHNSGGFRVSPEDGTNSPGRYRVLPLLLSSKLGGFRVLENRIFYPKNPGFGYRVKFG